MPFVTAQFNTKRLDEQLQKRSRGFKLELPDEMDVIGRMISVSLATSAQPYGVSDDARLKGEIATRRDIHRIYATPSMVYGDLSNGGNSAIAKAFYRAIKSGDYAKAQALAAGSPRFREASVGTFDGGELHRSRRNARGRVPGTQVILLIVTNTAELDAYIDAEIKQVGFGKAGWGNCAKAFKATGATRGLPAWVTRHRDAPASVAKRVTDTSVTVAMENLVPYAENLLDASSKSQAVAIGVERIVKSAVIAEKRAAAAAPLG